MKMFGFVKFPINKVFKQNSVDAGKMPPASQAQSDEPNNTMDRSRTSSEPNICTTDFSGEEIGAWSPATGEGFCHPDAMESRSVQELESYAVHRAGETTKTVGNCLKIAEDIRDSASNTLIVLQQQGDQISRTHLAVSAMDRDLTQGEKILGSLGGIFSKTWKPKKARQINGPVISNEGPIRCSENGKDKRKQLGLATVPKTALAGTRTSPSTPMGALEKVEVEKEKQDEGLSDLSSVIGDLKNMAFDMGIELDRQTKALDSLDEDMDELNSRVKGANQHARRLLGK